MEKERFVKLLLLICKGNKLWTADFLEQEAIRLFPNIININDISATTELEKILNKHKGFAGKPEI